MKNNSPKDDIFALPMNETRHFVFDEHVATVFNDMIKRSVPGYDAIISMIGVLAEQYAQDDSHCYDLGCSTGAVTLVMRHRIKKNNCKIISVDNSNAMVARCAENVKNDRGNIPVEIICSDIQDIVLEKASVVSLNFTLQFVAPEKRSDVLKNIYQAMVSGGILVLSEKISFKDKEEEQFQINMHHNFKKINGYSDLEISQKRTALENVLIPETLEIHLGRLGAVGFKHVYVWFQSFNFVSIIAIK